MDNLDIFKKVLELETVIKAYFEEINKQGIWIFLSCLSAFSAPNMALKILAFVIIGLMLFYTLYKTKAWSLAGSKSFKDTLSVYQKEMALLHKDLKCKAPLIEPNLRRNLGKWST